MQSFLVQSIKEIRNNLKGKEWRIKNRVPYLKYREMEIFRDIFSSLKPARILEWGSGFSTLYFPDSLDFSFKWTSLEHHEEWFAEISEMNKHSDVEIILQKANHFPYTDEHGDGAYDDFRDYIEFPDNGEKYDCIIIDGRARNDCLLKAENILNKDGVIILHDANRGRYKKYLNRFPEQALFEDYRRTAGGVWLGTTGRSLDELIDLYKHKKRWSLVRNKTAKVLAI